MADRTDICVVDDAAWERAVAREAVIRRLASSGSPGRAEFLSACRKLGIKRSRLYELIGVYKARPVTSSLLTAPAGSPAGGGLQIVQARRADTISEPGTGVSDLQRNAPC